ncbi:MAG: YggS family pyridoxal phosphate-dependent enzyme [Candidatus Krumholzibacteriia bacterium]
MPSLADNLARVRERIAGAARRAGRRPEEVSLVAVTKGQSLETLRALRELGLRDFGENRVQEALPKISAGLQDVRWHLIGHLQENKIYKVLPWVYMIQSIDSLRLARAVDARAERLGRSLPVLLEVKTAPEPTKHGIEPQEAVDAYAVLVELARLEPQGLMTVGPLTRDVEAVRASFRTLRREYERLQRLDPAPHILSMGMSDDLEIAVEEGATMVRVGRALVAP